MQQLYFGTLLLSTLLNKHCTVSVEMVYKILVSFKAPVSKKQQHDG